MAGLGRRLLAGVSRGGGVPRPANSGDGSKRGWACWNRSKGARRLVASGDARVAGNIDGVEFHGGAAAACTGARARVHERTT